MLCDVRRLGEDPYGSAHQRGREEGAVVRDRVGLRDHYDPEVDAAFRALVRGLNARVIVMSYNSEGLMSKDTIRRILAKVGKTSLKTIKYKKFKAQQGVSAEYVYEYIFVCHVAK